METAAQAFGAEFQTDALRRRIGEVFGEAFEKLLVKVGAAEPALASSERFAHGFVGSPATACWSAEVRVVNRRQPGIVQLANFYRAVRDEYNGAATNSRRFFYLSSFCLSMWTSTSIPRRPRYAFAILG